MRAYEVAEPYGGERYTLVRPDGYAGVSTSSPGELAAYLAMV
ncbi:hypothetical protein [Microbispora sp. H10836]|nr:hypothetical protein [Microbispora sp. H10836]